MEGEDPIFIWDSYIILSVVSGIIGYICARFLGVGILGYSLSIIILFYLLYKRLFHPKDVAMLLHALLVMLYIPLAGYALFHMMLNLLYGTVFVMSIAITGTIFYIKKNEFFFYLYPVYLGAYLLLIRYHLQNRLVYIIAIFLYILLIGLVVLGEIYVTHGLRKKESSIPSVSSPADPPFHDVSIGI